MNKLIDSELKKVKDAKIEILSDGKIFIKKKSDIKLIENFAYLIRLSDYMLNPPQTDNISINWNGGRIPKHRYYRVDIIKIVDNMIRVTGIGYDYSSRVDTNDIWDGWIPRDELEVIERI